LAGNITGEQSERERGDYKEGVENLVCDEHANLLLRVKGTLRRIDDPIIEGITETIII
jgi:hypothetical protein